MAEWKKVIVSGSIAQLAAVSASTGFTIGTNQVITTAQATTYLSGSFTGSFRGDGSGLSGIAASFPVVSTTDLATSNQIFVSDGASKYITYGNLVLDLAGSGAGTSNLTTTDTGDSLALTSQIAVTGVTASFTGSHIGSLTGTASYATQALSSSYALSVPFTGIIGAPAGAVSSSVFSSPSQGNASLITNGVSGSTISLGLTTGDSPSFNNLTLAGDLTVNGTTVTLNTNNLIVEDKFILLSSGSLSANDGGIIVQNAVGGTGYALYFDSTGDGTAPRWSFAEAANSTATSLTPTYFVGAVTGSAAAPSPAPTYGFGTIHVNSTNGDIYIYA